MNRRPADGLPRNGYRYVLTLFTSSLPMPVKLAADLAFPGIATFRSRTVEDGRERFRLHLGYFDALADAEQALATVRAHYPTALVAGVPPTNSSSLDDTVNTAFTLVRGAVARLVTADVSAAAGSTSQQRSPAAAVPSPTLTPSEVASVMAPQRYAVQLDWSLQPIAASSIPRLGIFRAYNLYAVSVLRQGCPEHGLRLGFFKNLDGARQVADYVRHEFARASIVPVSYREYSRASALTGRDATAPPADAAGAPEAAQDAVAAACAAAPQASPASPPPAAAPAAPPPAAAPAAEPRTRDELLRLLGAHELEVDRERGARATLTAEERALLQRRPQRNLRHW